MRNTRHLVSLACIAALSLCVACGGDDDTPADDTRTGGSDGADGSGGNGDAGAPSQDGSGGSEDGTGGGSQTGCDTSGEGLPRETIPNQIDNDTTLTSDTVWVLEGTTYVGSGATLTIEPCTRIEGEFAPLGTLVVSRGGRLVADGTADEPILFTSVLPRGDRAPGDWGGVILLGRAPNFKGDNVTIEGLEEDPVNQYGGSDAADDSGVLRYVRIEYSGYELSTDNEINGLTMGSVGSGTVLEHVMVSNTLDDCFEWFGGTVDGRYLICNNAGDDMFDMDQGYQGNLQYLFGRQVEPISSNPNGFECDSSNEGDTPVSRPNVSNVTLCGTGSAGRNITYGAVFRERLEGTFMNMIITGFEIGIDARDDFGTADDPNVEVTYTIFHDNFGHDIADTGEEDNDLGFDEQAWIGGSGRNNSTDDPGIGDCGPTGTPEPWPSSAIGGGAPSGDLERAAAYIGAFEDANDDWITGAWVDWARN